MSETKMALVRIDEAKLARLDAAQSELADLACGQVGSMTQVIRQAQAIQALREMLTPEIMAPIMALMGNPLGFLADRPNKRNPTPYDVDTVRDVVIWAAGKGARLVGNETNIVSGRGYLTKAFFQRRLDESLGAGRWQMIHAVPKTMQNGDKIGALVKTRVRWMDGTGAWQEQELEHAIKGDDYASTDSYCGKADRKCGAWLLARVSGMRYEDGDADDSIPTTATPVGGPLRPPAGAPETVEAQPATQQ